MSTVVIILAVIGLATVINYVIKIVRKGREREVRAAVEQAVKLERVRQEMYAKTPENDIQEERA